MKKILFLACCLFICAGISAQKNLLPGTYAFITIENTADFARKNVPVALRVSDLTEKMPKYRGQDIAIFSGSKEIFAQYDDLDHDGTTDEIAFLVDLKAGEKKRLYVRTLPKDQPRPNFPKEVFAQMLRKVKVGNTESLDFVTEASSEKDDMYNQMYHHGVAFETDLIAYRLYFDKKQTVDVYGKIKPQLEIAQSRWYPTDAQLAVGFGDDILKVGSSVGVGTFKGWDGSQATHFEQMSRRTQRVVATGNLRNIVEIDVEGWQYGNEKIDVAVRYTQYARHRDVQVDVLFKTPLQAEHTFATGVQRMPEETFHTDNGGLAGIWGTDYPVNDTVKYAKQTVGLGVFVPTEFVQKQVEDKRNHLVLMDSAGNIRYYLTATALKEKKGFKNAETFFKYLEMWKKELQNPVKVSITN